MEDPFLIACTEEKIEGSHESTLGWLDAFVKLVRKDLQKCNFQWHGLTLILMLGLYRSLVGLYALA